MNDGGPAFPRIGYVMSQDCDPEQWQTGFEGMSLRDYFAGQLATGLVASRNICGRCPGSDKRIAEISYHLSDAMLVERNEEHLDRFRITLQQSAYLWLGNWRDKLPEEAVTELQDLLGPLE